MLTPWPVALAWRLGGFGPLFETVWLHTFIRYVNAWDNLEPWWYYASALLMGLFPWSLALVGLASGRCRKQMARCRISRWLLIWSALRRRFFLPVGWKNAACTFCPMMPAIALILARSTPDLLRDRWTRSWLALAGMAAATVLLFLAGSVALAPDGGGAGSDEAAARFRSAGPDWASRSLSRARGMLLFAVAAVRRSGLLVWGPAGFALVSGLLSPLVLVPALNEAQQARAATSLLVGKSADDQRLGACRSKWELLAWYSGRRLELLESPRDVLEFLENPGGGAVICRARQLPPSYRWPDGTRVEITETYRPAATPPACPIEEHGASRRGDYGSRKVIVGLRPRQLRRPRKTDGLPRGHSTQVDAAGHPMTMTRSKKTRARGTSVRDPLQVNLRWLVLLILVTVIIPTSVLTGVGIAVIVARNEALDLVFGVLVISFASSVIAGATLLIILARRGARLARIQETFLSHMGHELLTPLAGNPASRPDSRRPVAPPGSKCFSGRDQERIEPAPVSGRAHPALAPDSLARPPLRPSADNCDPRSSTS